MIFTFLQAIPNALDQISITYKKDSIWGHCGPCPYQLNILGSCECGFSFMRSCFGQCFGFRIVISYFLFLSKNFKTVSNDELVSSFFQTFNLKRSSHQKYQLWIQPKNQRITMHFSLFCVMVTINYSSRLFERYSKELLMSQLYPNFLTLIEKQMDEWMVGWTYG